MFVKTTTCIGIENWWLWNFLASQIHIPILKPQSVLSDLWISILGFNNNMNNKTRRLHVNISVIVLRVELHMFLNWCIQLTMSTLSSRYLFNCDVLSITYLHSSEILFLISLSLVVIEVCCGSSCLNIQIYPHIHSLRLLRLYIWKDVIEASEVFLLLVDGNIIHSFLIRKNPSVNHQNVVNFN